MLQIYYFQGPFGSTLNFWDFIKALRWLEPTLAPSIEMFSPADDSGHQGEGQGELWVKQSLIQHQLSYQLYILVNSGGHIVDHYEGKKIELIYLSGGHFCKILSQKIVISENFVVNVDIMTS
ncbi:unnamed protein product [Owenia fusiformis]|uniref:RUN domain-containing protein n=1 Tax=Owenia fusiformis TaxID=6347 RepID=A0A8S4NKI2_OWEFU|nr:unnamed protein product [Owenia fusiformis]